jgi:hypothetical protein
MIEDEFIKEIPTELNNGAKYILDAFRKFHGNIHQQGANVHDGYIEYCTLLEAFLRHHNYIFEQVYLDANKNENIKKVLFFYSTVEGEFEIRLTNDAIENSRNRFDQMFNNSFTYVFTDGDLERIQLLINELRTNLNNSEVFTAEHKSRLLKRLEKLQSELHKKVSDLDKFWGLIGDAGVAIGKFGNDAKPFVDRIKEIADIVWRTQANAEQLPSGSTIPFLASGEEE